MLKFLSTSSTGSSQSASGGTEPGSSNTGTDETVASGSTNSAGPVQPSLSSGTGEEQTASEASSESVPQATVSAPPDDPAERGMSGSTAVSGVAVEFSEEGPFAEFCLGPHGGLNRLWV